jgi:hypothetical protein
VILDLFMFHPPFKTRQRARAEFIQFEALPMFVTAGLDPAISVDPRVKPGDDDWGDRSAA